MKKLLYILLFIPFVSFSQVNVGSDGAIHSTGNFPSTVQRESKGFSLSVQSLVDRDAIASNRRDTGMVIFVRDSLAAYSLVGGITNSDWTKVTAVSNSVEAGTQYNIATYPNNGTILRGVPFNVGEFTDQLNTGNTAYYLWGSGAGKRTFFGTQSVPMSIDMSRNVTGLALHSFVIDGTTASIGFDGGSIQINNWKQIQRSNMIFTTSGNATEDNFAWFAGPSIISPLSSYGDSTKQKMTLAGITGDLLIGRTFDRGYKLDVFGNANIENTLKIGQVDLGLAGTDSVLVINNGVVKSVPGNSFSGGSSPTIAGGPFTTIPTVGFNPGTGITAEAAFVAAFYGAQPPTAGLSGTSPIEFSSASTTAQTLNWSGGRGSNTPTLTSIVITGASQTYTETFSQPSQSSSVSGTQSVNVPSNSVGLATTFTNTVTDATSVQKTATVTITALGKWYYGFVNSSITTPSNSDIIGLTGTLTASLGAIKTQTAGSPSVANSTASRFVVSVPASLDASSTLQIWINGLDVTTGFTESTVSVTNASGGVQNYHVYVQNTITNAGITFQIK